MRRVFVVLLLLVSGLPSAIADDELLMDIYVVTPLPGQRLPLEQAVNDHMNHRLANGESRGWVLYVPMLGQNIGRLMLYYCCDNWNDMESYYQWEEQSEMRQHWMDFVEPFVQQVDHYISVVDAPNSSWDDYTKVSPYLNVTEYHLNPGHREPTKESIKILSDYVKALEWQSNWIWSWQMGGDPVLNLVIPQESIFDLSSQRFGFEGALGEYLGDAEKARQLLVTLRSHYSHTYFQLYRLRRQLDPKNEEPPLEPE
ncbi:hypothetical protein [Ferrimonas balearica]|uniref:hypothetical protein n=1 Tax=Ferrimonas balearica TaxID=44012 RepID=UPI001C98F35F|nr:hypothetical protein [Ferrimonas balearica]MBY5991394.1 hypothetical protein [Ferrimonas balearica]